MSLGAGDRSSIRVALVDADPSTRFALRLLLNATDGIEVVAEADDGAAVLPLVERRHPDVVLMDVRMPILDGITTTRLLRTHPSRPAVLILTASQLDDLVIAALHAGAAGFLRKDTPPADLIRAIEHVHGGDGEHSPFITSVRAQLDVDQRVQIALVLRDGKG